MPQLPDDVTLGAAVVGRTRHSTAKADQLPHMLQRSLPADRVFQFSRVDASGQEKQRKQKNHGTIAAHPSASFFFRRRRANCTTADTPMPTTYSTTIGTANTAMVKASVVGVISAATTAMPTMAWRR